MSNLLVSSPLILLIVSLSPCNGCLKCFAYAIFVFFEVHVVHEGVYVTMLILVIHVLLDILVEVVWASIAHNVLRKCDTYHHVSKDFSTLMHTQMSHEQVDNKLPNRALKKDINKPNKTLSFLHLSKPWLQVNLVWSAKMGGFNTFQLY